MRKFLFATTLLCIVITTAKAQNLLSKVPKNAVAVIKYSGESLAKNVPLQKLDAYGFVKNNFLKMLRIDTLSSLQNIGIDFGQDSYQYVNIEDTSLNFVTLLHLKNAPQFLQLIKATYGKKLLPEKKNGFEFLTIDDDTYVGWNESLAVVVNSSYQNKKNYYDYLYRPTEVASDSAYSGAQVPVDTPITFTPPKIVKDKKTATKRPATKPVVKGKAPVKKATPKKKAPITDEEVIVEAPRDSVYMLYKRTPEDSIAELKRELWQQQQDMITARIQKAEAENILSNTFTGVINTIENEAGYKKIVDPASHVSAWANTETLTTLYTNTFFRSGFYRFYDKPIFKKDSGVGFNSSINIYFEKDKMRVEQKTFSTDTELQSLGKGLMNSKQSIGLANYVNPGNVGYLSLSTNTEAGINYYYTVMKKYLSTVPYMNDYADVLNIYVDLLQIAIDEKGIADLIPGNYLFVLHDLKSRMVTYTDYDYDKDFKQTEVKKTKKELSPNFSFIIETRKEDFMEKLAKLPLKYAAKEHYNYKDQGGYYELAFEEGKFPISSLYFIVKNGKAIVTTSKEVIDMTLNNTAFATDADTKQSILNNNYSLKLNSKLLLEKIGTEFNSSTSKKICDYLMENIGDVKIESSFKDGMIQGTTTMAVSSKNANSFEFFFNMIDAINNIIEKDKQEKSLN